MSQLPLVECVPNFSEGRRPEVIDAIAQAIAAAGVTVLDVSSDADHNRTVITFAGHPDAVAEAAYQGIAQAARHIDLTAHSGQHPRIGAADVVPFVPLRHISLQECAALAHRVGQRVGSQLGLPVYYYDAAARHPDRRTLPQVRRDPYETLRHTIHTDPSRAPDEGPAQLGPAGAVAIGARQPLIAFNLYLNTSDVEIARAIARAVRESGGGLPHLRALGLFVDGRAQVSLNLTDFRITGLYAAFEAVRAQAVLHGVDVESSEIVGLVPQQALIDAALAHLRLPPHAQTLVLEHRMGQHSGDYRPIPFE